jgi:N-acetylglucosamine-6-sulfatase
MRRLPFSTTHLKEAAMSSIRLLISRIKRGAATALLGCCSIVAAYAVFLPLGPVQRGVAATTTSPLPNIVEIMVDDMRADDLSWMPYLRRLMHTQGLEFRNSFSSFPLCCPARASFFSGQYPHNHRVLHHNPPYGGYGRFNDRYTLATALQDVGYHTGLVGKYLNRFGQDDSLVGSEEAGHPVPSYNYVPHGWDDFRAIIQHPMTGLTNGNYFDEVYDLNGTPSADFRGKYNTITMTDMAVNMTRKFHTSPQPFFVSLNYKAPHWSKAEEVGDPVHVRLLNGTYTNFLTTERPDWVKGHFDRVITHGQGMPRDGSQPEPDVSDKPTYFRLQPRFSSQEMRAETQVTRQRAESLFVVDTQVRRLVQELQAQREWLNTVLMFTSDNGYMLGEHRVRQEKIRAHEPSLRVPFLITGPGMRQGERRYDPISTVDVAATIIALAGAEPPHTPDGFSLVASMRSGDRGWIHPVVTEGYKTSNGAFDTGLSSIGVRTPRYSFIDYARGVDELYDLWTDPLENRNRIADPTYATVARQLRAMAWKLHDCAGLECHVELPTQFARTPAQTRTLTEHYFWAAQKRFGYGVG